MKKKKFFLILLILIGGVVGIKRGIVFWQERWDKKSQINLLVEKEKEFWLVAADPEREAVFVAVFPSSLLIEAFGDYGFFTLNSLYGLAEQEKKPWLVKKSVEYFFGFPLDFWLLSSREGESSSDEIADLLVAEVKKKIFSWKGKGLGERFDLFLFSRFLDRHDLLWEIQRGEEGLIKKEEGRGEENLFRLKRKEWDQWASLYLADPGFKKEGLSVAVYNTTGETGLANRVARVLTNAGVWVVKVGDREEEIEGCLLGVKEKEVLRKKSLRRLRKLVDCSLKVLPSEEFTDFAEVNLYLGEGFWEIEK